MRHLFPLLPLLLLLVLTACGGTNPTSKDNAPGPAGEPRVLASASGSAGAAREPQASPQGTVEAPPFQLVQGLALEGVTSTPIASGGYTFSGKVVNQGQETQRATRISIELLDGSGQLAAKASFSNPQLPALKPGESASWQGSLTFATSPWQEMRPTVEGTTAKQ